MYATRRTQTRRPPACRNTISYERDFSSSRVEGESDLILVAVINEAEQHGVAGFGAAFRHPLKERVVLEHLAQRIEELFPLAPFLRVDIRLIQRLGVVVRGQLLGGNRLKL